MKNKMKSNVERQIREFRHGVDIPARLYITISDQVFSFGGFIPHNKHNVVLKDGGILSQALTPV